MKCPGSPTQQICQIKCFGGFSRRDVWLLIDGREDIVFFSSSCFADGDFDSLLISNQIYFTHELTMLSNIRIISIYWCICIVNLWHISNYQAIFSNKENFSLYLINSNAKLKTNFNKTLTHIKLEYGKE